VVKVASSTDGAGKIASWDYDVYFAGDRGAELFYDVRTPGCASSEAGAGRERKPTASPSAPGVPPGANMNVFARESQIDVMAAAAGLDPVEFRLRNMSDERMRRALQEAAKAFGWKPAAAPSRRGWGVACGIDAGTYAVLAVQVAVDRASGQVRVERVVCAQDMGVVVNPEGATMQMEGCITMGLGYVLTEELRFRGGSCSTRTSTPTSCRACRGCRDRDAAVPNDAVPPQGGGEPAIVPMGAAIANAFFDATGVRIYRLPLDPERVKAALTKA